MIIKKMDALGISIKGKWIRYDHTEFPKGELYTFDEIQKEVKRILLKQKSVPIEDYVKLKRRIESIKQFILRYLEAAI